MLQFEFIHSIGVYHLGRKVFDSVHNSLGSLEQTFPEELDNIKRLFELACLLHDVGHAPFSHTEERFFLADAANPPAIYAKLIALVSDPDFSDDFDYYCDNGKVAIVTPKRQIVIFLIVLLNCLIPQLLTLIGWTILFGMRKQRDSRVYPLITKDF
ncbi:hypothetical protein SBF1_380002 [Candidatus Desulfosporosinus infrequens]|uniref:HD domain-containing protein n=1 Tax=Candidatus Desulfosporosinus infrequens TaxID=2043169 RepID=A0A2U3L5F6_9FIRM|nr:HD domain-containing protein [Desulfosporosinus sp.]SPF47141.1 hypothetical protein SBF1_380002 [Candidatus Desulfosporosinus infrequens]